LNGLGRERASGAQAGFRGARRLRAIIEIQTP
jgi:hypothetical protein